MVSAILGSGFPDPMHYLNTGDYSASAEYGSLGIPLLFTTLYSSMDR